jgi:hypothetical protein
MFAVDGRRVVMVGSWWLGMPRHSCLRADQVACNYLLASFLLHESTIELLCKATVTDY